MADCGSLIIDHQHSQPSARNTLIAVELTFDGVTPTSLHQNMFLSSLQHIFPHAYVHIPSASSVDSFLPQSPYPVSRPLPHSPCQSSSLPPPPPSRGPTPPSHSYNTRSSTINQLLVINLNGHGHLQTGYSGRPSPQNTHQQSIPPPPPVNPYYCSTCKVNGRNPAGWMTHTQGSQHRGRVLLQALNSGSQLTEDKGGLEVGLIKAPVQCVNYVRNLVQAVARSSKQCLTSVCSVLLPRFKEPREFHHLKRQILRLY